MDCELTDCGYNEGGKCGALGVRICKIVDAGRVPEGWCVCDNYEKGE